MVWKLSGMGFEFIAGVVGLGFVGWMVDRWRGSPPLWTLVGVGVGMIGGGYNFIKQAFQAEKMAQAAYRRAHPDSAGHMINVDDEEPADED